MEATEEAAGIEEFKKINEQLSDEEKKGNIGKILNNILSLLKAGWSLTRAIEDVKSLQDITQYKKEVKDLFDKLIKENSRCNEKIAQEFEEHTKKCSSWWKKNTVSLEDLRKKFLSDANVEKVREDVLNAIDEHHKKECNRVVQDMVNASKVMAALYALKLYMAWKKISAASNVIEDKNKFRQIETNLHELEEMVAGLVTLCSAEPKANYENINNRMMYITSTYTATLGLIGDVRVTINGHIQTLDLLADVTAVDGVMSFATAAAQGYEVWNTWENLTSLTKSLGVASTAVFTFFGFANAHAYLMTQEKLKQLREDLKNTNSFKCDLDKLHDKARRAIAERIV